MITAAEVLLLIEQLRAAALAAPRPGPGTRAIVTLPAAGGEAEEPPNDAPPGKLPILVILGAPPDLDRLLPSTEAVTVVVLGEPAAAASPVAGLRARFGLTAAEARLALALAEADGLTDIARRLGVRMSTARTHLQRVFAKTGTHRQGELVRLLLAPRLPAAPPPPARDGTACLRQINGGPGAAG